MPPLLRASHIKPWVDCASEAERLDVFNGLLLAPHLDAAFDGGWITFEDDGTMRVSPLLATGAREVLGLDVAMRVDRLTNAHLAYLDHHRVRLFRVDRKSVV